MCLEPKRSSVAALTNPPIRLMVGKYTAPLPGPSRNIRWKSVKESCASESPEGRSCGYPLNHNSEIGLRPIEYTSFSGFERVGRSEYWGRQNYQIASPYRQADRQHVPCLLEGTSSNLPKVSPRTAGFLYKGNSNRISISRSSLPCL